MALLHEKNAPDEASLKNCANGSFGEKKALTEP